LATGFISSGLSLVIGRAYFAAASGGSGIPTNFVLMDLESGVIKTATAGNIAANSTLDGRYGVGVDFNAGTGTVNVGPNMWANAYYSVQQLLDWAKDPWAFWYPDAEYQDFTGIAGSAPPPPASVNLRMMMGYGT